MSHRVLAHALRPRLVGLRVDLFTLRPFVVLLYPSIVQKPYNFMVVVVVDDDVVVGIIISWSLLNPMIIYRIMLLRRSCTLGRSLFTDEPPK